MVWEQEEPQLTTCCICPRGVTPSTSHIQSRPTGPEKQMQEWVFCSPCWKRHKQICANRKPVDGERLKSLAKYLQESAY